MEIERELAARRLRDLPWRQNSFEVWWPQVPMDVCAIGRRALAEFAHTSAFFAWAIPSVKSLEDELSAMLREILNVPEDGRVTITLGGTESNFLAVKTARDRARAAGQVAGRIVLPRTAHPSLDKAADLMDVEVVRVPAHMSVVDEFLADTEWAIGELIAGRGSNVGMDAVYSVEFPEVRARGDAHAAGQAAAADRRPATASPSGVRKAVTLLP